jgi:two-component system response regulator GlrR
MVATALEIEGYRVDEAADAHEGLNKLAQHHYHLVLSDYAMPGGTGTWMLQQAAKRGLMERTVALMVTAHPDVRELADVAVISKPLDLDYFLEQVRKLLASFGVEAARPAPPPPHKVEFVLYVSSTSPASIQARQNLSQLLEGFDVSQVKYTIVDLLKDPMAGEHDRIAFTPTLVKRHPGPRTWILGNLRNRHMLFDLLKAAGIDEVR